MKTHMSTPSTRKRVLKAIKDLSGIVQVTLGPGGRPILLERENQHPLSTRDGVTVARHFKGDGDIERVVSDAAKEVCERTVKNAGDGTTTAIVLAAALTEAGQKYLEKHPGHSPQNLCRQLKMIFKKEIEPMILEKSRSIRNLPKEEAFAAVRHVALISSNHDSEIADAVAEAVDYVGEDGMIVAEEGAGADTRVDHREGFSFNSGLSDLGGGASTSFINRKDYGDCVVEGCYVCLYDGEISDPNTIAPLLEKIHSEIGSDGNPVRSPVVIFAHKFSDTVLVMLAKNFRRGVLTAIPVITPRNGQSNGRSQFLWDLAAYAGGKVFDAQGAPLPEAHLPQLGFAESVKLQRSEGLILGEPNQGSIETRIEELKIQMTGVSEFDADLLRYRIGRMTGGIATIYAGGMSALEARERHARVVDAICATRSALEKGVVPGGGALLAAIGTYFEKQSDPVYEIFSQALKKPFFQIMENAGIDSVNLYEDIGYPVGDTKNFMVYDALERASREWWSAGILDPTKVTLTALDSALSVSQLLMTLGGLITHEVNEGTKQVKAMQDGLLKAIEGEAMA